MSEESIPTRRAFLKGGVIIAAPLAVVGAPALASGDDRLARLTRLEDEAAIRSLHQDLLRHLNGGAGEGATPSLVAQHDIALDEAIRAVTVDHAGDPDSIAIAPDGRSASGRFACLVETGAMLPPDNTLAQMAHAQGTGFVRETGRAVMRADFVKTEQGWAIAQLDLARV